MTASRPSPRRLVAAAILAAAACAPARPGLAQEAAPGHAAAAERLLEALRTRELTAQMMEQLPAMIAPVLPAGDGTDAAARDELMRSAIEFIDARIGYDALEDDYVALYVAAYDEADTVALADFFESDLGRRYTDAMPGLLTATGQLVQERLGAAMPELIEHLQAEAERLSGGRK